MDLYIYVFDYFYQKARRALFREEISEYEKNVNMLKKFSTQYYDNATRIVNKIYIESFKLFTYKLHEKLYFNDYDYFFDTFELDERTKIRYKIPVLNTYEETCKAREILFNKEKEIHNFNEKRHIKRIEQNNHTIPFFGSDLTIFFD